MFHQMVQLLDNSFFFSVAFSPSCWIEPQVHRSLFNSLAKIADCSSALCNKHSYLCKLYNRHFLVTILSWEHACTECAWLKFSVTASVDREVICHHIKFP
jgi:hypothetical protein